MLCSEFVDSQPAYVYAHGTGRRGLSSSEPQGESFYNSLTAGVSDDAGGHEKRRQKFTQEAVKQRLCFCFPTIHYG